MAATVWWSSPGARVGEKVEDLFFLAAFLLLANCIVTRLSRDALSFIWSCFAIVGLLYFLEAMVSGPDIQGRYAAFGGGPNVFVRVMLLGAFGALYYALRHNRMWVLLLLPVYLTGAVLSGSRGGIVAVCLALLVVGFPIIRSTPRRLLPPLTGALAVLLFAGWRLADTVVGSTLRERYLASSIEQNDSARSEIFTVTLSLIERRPLFGNGLDSFYALYGVSTGYEYAHNLVLSALSDGGVLSLLLLVLALVSLLRGGRATKPATLETKFAMLAGTFIFFASLFSGDYYDSRFMWLMFVIAAVEGRRRV